MMSTPDNEAAITADLDLVALIELHESIVWRDVPGITAAEAATWNQRLQEARDHLRDEVEPC